MTDINRANTITDEEVAEIFDYHPWNSDQVEHGRLVRRALGDAFKAVIDNVPPCPDRTVALRKIREALSAANCATTHGGRF